MFNVLFRRKAAIAHHSSAPLLTERLRYLEDLRERGAARKTLTLAAHRMLCIGAMLRWRIPRPVTAKQIDTAANRWITRPGQRYTSGKATSAALVSTARSWFRFLGLLQAPSVEKPCGDEIEGYARFMLEERNLSSVTIRTRCGRAAEFLRCSRSKDATSLISNGATWIKRWP